LDSSLVPFWNDEDAFRGFWKIAKGRSSFEEAFHEDSDGWERGGIGSVIHVSGLMDVSDFTLEVVDERHRQPKCYHRQGATWRDAFFIQHKKVTKAASWVDDSC
jgi:hypothetical protein